MSWHVECWDMAGDLKLFFQHSNARSREGHPINRDVWHHMKIRVADLM